MTPEEQKKVIKRFNKSVYHREYYQRPGVKEKQKIRRKEYNNRPETKLLVKEYRKQWNKTPSAKKYYKSYNKKYYQEHKDTPEYKAYQAEYTSRPEVRERKRIWMSNHRYLQHRHNKGDLTDFKRKPDYTNEYYCITCRESSPKTGSRMCSNCGKKMRAGPARVPKTKEVHRY